MLLEGGFAQRVRARTIRTTQAPLTLTHLKSLPPPIIMLRPLETPIPGLREDSSLLIARLTRPAHPTALSIPLPPALHYRAILPLPFFPRTPLPPLPCTRRPPSTHPSSTPSSPLPLLHHLPPQPTFPPPALRDLLPLPPPSFCPTSPPPQQQQRKRERWRRRGRRRRRRRIRGHCTQGGFRRRGKRKAGSSRCRGSMSRSLLESPRWRGRGS
mmetsp:Transcript_20249/g.48937  ORF Transcript_20249/g.48937 Transcript_20249/m.48937 type:complete len:213 (-) Transcript_20249:33-671(-)